MIVSVRGAKDRELTKLLKLAADSFANKLFSPQLLKNLILKIMVKPATNMVAGGYCNIADDDEGTHPRIFDIEIAKTKKKIHMFTVLAHEMVHMKQFATGEMKDRYVKTQYVTVWRGDKYEDDVSYWDQPWEIEAYGLENSLVAKFLIEHNQFKNLRQKQEEWFVYDDDTAS
jgi:hypothetical protein